LGRGSILLCHNKIVLGLTIANRSLSFLSVKAQGTAVLGITMLVQGRVFWYSRASQAGLITFLDGYNHSVFKAEFGGF
jgi:hypothetical protein